MSRLQTFLYTIASLFALLCILFIPFPFYLFSHQGTVTELLFGSLIKTTTRAIYGINLTSATLSSDTVSMYILLLILLVLAIIITLLLSLIKKWGLHRQQWLALFYIICCYYLSLMLIKYGADKICKSQFYLPEPNTLYTPLGKITKDLLFWSTMGASRSYNIFMGLAELIPGVLLLFKKTRVVGLLILAALLLNVVFINFSYDISVKIYSCFLLFLSLLLLSPQLSRLYRFFIKQEYTQPRPEPVGFSFLKHRFGKAFLKTAIVFLILTEAFYPYIQTGNFNDDIAARPYLHGAYEVKQAYAQDTASSGSLPVKRIFIHRSGYLIFQDNADNMQDYKLYIDSIRQQFVITDYQLNEKRMSYRYIEKDSILELQYADRNNKYLLKAKQLNWKELPALKNQFHWTTDGNRY